MPKNATEALVEALKEAAEAARAGGAVPSPKVWNSLRLPKGYSAAEEAREENVLVRVKTDLPLRPSKRDKEGRPKGRSLSKVLNCIITNRLREEGVSYSEALAKEVGWVRSFRAPLVEDADGRVYILISRRLLKEEVGTRKTRKK